jgi:hypothetical protein
VKAGELVIGLAGNYRRGIEETSTSDLSAFNSCRLSPVFFQPLCFVLAVVLTLTGVWVNWRAHVYRMSAEEAMKDGKLTHDQVESRLRLITNGSRFLTLTGMALLIVSMFVLTE